MASRSNASVLLTGESGTGKDLLAAYVHRSSPYSSGQFVKVNCDAMPDALVESDFFGEGLVRRGDLNAPREARTRPERHCVPG